jgi:hypothetical protein
MADEAKVIGLYSGVDIQAMEPNGNTVKTLEHALAQAKAGEIVGVGIAKTHHDNMASFHLGGKVLGYAFMGAVSRMLHTVMVDADRHDEEND